MNSPRRKHLRSIPVTQRNKTTEIYLLRKEKERIENEKKRLVRREAELNHRLEDIQQELTFLVRDWQSEIEEIAVQNQIRIFETPDQEFKAKPLKY